MNERFSAEDFADLVDCTLNVARLQGQDVTWVSRAYAVGQLVEVWLDHYPDPMTIRSLRVRFVPCRNKGRLGPILDRIRRRLRLAVDRVVRGEGSVHALAHPDPRIYQPMWMKPKKKGMVTVC